MKTITANSGETTMRQAICAQCGMEMRGGPTLSTLAMYSSPPGHDHNDNCRVRIYRCQNGHETVVNRQNKCPACDWRGKLQCFCHKGAKVLFWPDEDQPL